MRTVSGGKWTADGRWVVVGDLVPGVEVILFDPHNAMRYTGAVDIGMFIWDIQDCHDFIKANQED
jgi:hypothetical protein